MSNEPSKGVRQVIEQLTRYHLTGRYGGSVHWREHANGDWVRWDDLTALLAGLPQRSEKGKEQEDPTRVDDSQYGERSGTAARVCVDPPSWCPCVTECQFAADEVQGRAEAGCIRHFNQGDARKLRRKVLRACNLIRMWGVGRARPQPGTLASLLTLLGLVVDALAGLPQTPPEPKTESTR